MATMLRSFVPRTGSRHLASTALRVLGIESSFDDSSIAVVDGSGAVLANVTRSQREHHLASGGTIPSLAGTLHRDNLPLVLAEALGNARVQMQDLDAIAFTLGPGLAPCLKEGLTFSRKLASDFQKPLIPVHHMEAHLLTARMFQQVDFPMLVLLASGGHCLLVLAKGLGEYQRLGQTLDDPPGEAFDKVARRLRLKGGAHLEAVAQSGDPTVYDFTLPLLYRRDCNFSFAGLKTNVERVIRRDVDPLPEESAARSSVIKNIAASFQRVVFEHMRIRTLRAFAYAKLVNTPAKVLVISGGVACNSVFRQVMRGVAGLYDADLAIPPMEWCQDNGAMIAWTGLEYYRNSRGICLEPLALRYHPSWPLGDDISEAVTAQHIHVRQPLLKLRK
eukprot:m.135746 g.135746  ORF g.135746 m.135746 type:complete len:390 (+) comp52462_c0_seq3:89-1258(+)